MTDDPQPRRAVQGLTRGGLARALGVAARTVDGWLENGCPRHPDGSYDIETVKKWREDRAAERRRKLHPAGDDLGVDWVKRDARAVALIREKKLADLYENYFHRDDVSRLFTLRANHLRRGLLALPRAVAQEFRDVQGLEEHVEARVHELLAAYAKDNVVTLLTQWRRQGKHGVKIGRGRGRPKGT